MIFHIYIHKYLQKYLFQVIDSTIMAHDDITLLSAETKLNEAVNRYLRANTPKFNKNYPIISNLELPNSDHLIIG